MTNTSSPTTPAAPPAVRLSDWVTEYTTASGAKLRLYRYTAPAAGKPEIGTFVCKGCLYDSGTSLASSELPDYPAAKADAEQHAAACAAARRCGTCGQPRS